MTDANLQQLDGVLLTDQRGTDEAVMLIWLVPGGGGDALIARILERHVIVGAMHITRGSGTEQTEVGAPTLLTPARKRVEALEHDDLTKDMLRVLARVKEHLTSREADGTMEGLGPLAERLSFYIFETGKVPVGPGWTVAYAGASYPMRAAQS